MTTNPAELASALLITGTVGAGKTTVGQAVADLFVDRKIPRWQLIRTSPASPRSSTPT